MDSLIKNQLLKHLSRYTKNLSMDNINLSTFRGEGELSKLELDEGYLTELLELPSWLKLTTAWCNHVSFRISWTKLKSVPITLTLDEVNITVETCDPNARTNPESPGGSAGGGSNTNLPQSHQVPQGKYSYIHKIVDGITIIVNNVNVKFLSAAFTASVQMSRIRVESKTPLWETADLRFTRLKDGKKGIILIFKELSWQTVRIEVSSTQDRSLRSLLLLTNQARCRITIRKRLSDCSLLASRLVLILQELHSVLTDYQLNAALHFIDSLSGLIKSATHVTQKKNAARKLQTLPEYQAQIAQQQNRQGDSSHTSGTQRKIRNADVRETSYHFLAEKIDFFLIDDEGGGRSTYPELDKGGSMKISIQAFQVDYYPYHLAKSDRTHWAKYEESSMGPALWLKESLNSFREAILNLSQPNRPSTHAPLERTTPMSPVLLNAGNLNVQFNQNTSSNGSNTPTGPGMMPSNGLNTRETLENLAKLMSACVILRIKDFTLYRVTTPDRKQMPKEFISGDKDRYSFPADMDIIHAEFTYFYYPGDFVFPLPPSKMFVHIRPVQVQYDMSSILWLNSFGLNLHQNLLQTSVGSPSSTKRGSTASETSHSESSHGGGTTLNASNQAVEEPSLMYMDVKVEAIMPRIIIESTADTPNQKDRPKIMQIGMSRLAVTNIREMGSSRADLAQALHSLQEGSLIFETDFPAAEGDMCVITDRILAHVAASDVGPAAQQYLRTDIDREQESMLPKSIPKSASSQCLSRYAMWSEPRDVWCIKLDPLWIDFLGTRSIGSNKSIPFVDAVPITLWLHTGNNDNTNLNFPTATFAGHGNGSGHNLGNGSAYQNAGSDSQASTAKGSSVETNIHCIDTITCINVTNIPRNPFLSDEDLRNPLTNGAFNSTSKPNVSNDFVDMGTERVADMHAIAHISNLVSIQIDHYQLLFLLRLAEELDEMTTFLSLDSAHILQSQAKKNSLVFGCVVPQIEITLIMPSPTPGKESSGGDAESVLPDSASLGDDLHMNSTNVQWPPPTLEQFRNNTFGSVETPSPITHDFAFDIHTSNPNTHGFNVQIQSTPTLASSTTTSQTSRLDTGIYSQSAASSSKSLKSTRNSTSEAPSFKKEINSGLMSMKKGFSSIMTSIDSAMKSSGPNDDISDTVSIQSDISSDSENYAILMGDERTIDCLDIMFKWNFSSNENNIKASPVEVASEVFEEPNFKTNLSSPSEPSEASTWRRRDLVSMATFRLTTVELIHQNEGNRSTVRAQVAAVSCNECGAIPWDELQTKFNARCKAWNLAQYNPEAPPCIRLRFEKTLKTPDNPLEIPDKKSIPSWFQQKGEIRVRDVNMDLNMSTVVGLGDLAEDEIISNNHLPLDIYVENCKINLIEDRPPVNITSPGPVPINLAVGRMHLKRDEKGVLHIQPIQKSGTLVDHNYGIAPVIFGQSSRERDRELLSLHLVMQQLKHDNENLRKQITNAENHRQKSIKENDVLRSYLKAAKDDVSNLLDEKKDLIDTIRSLELQMASLSINKKSDGKR